MKQNMNKKIGITDLLNNISHNIQVQQDINQNVLNIVKSSLQSNFKSSNLIINNINKREVIKYINL